jgi:16S rRNA (uracil1498-N3)-methyltransferase
VKRRFFVEKFEPNSATLRGDAAEHLGRVLRAAPGQLYELSDGASVWLARIERVVLSKGDHSSVEFTLVEQIPARESQLRIRLLLSVIKFDRFEWCLEKATELGATEITPLSAARSDKPLLAAAAKRRARWEKILLESAQQSRRLRAPLLSGVERPADAFKGAQSSVKIFLSERNDAKPIRASLNSASASDVALAFGPEGGWTDEEIAVARSSGFAEASLGENILRTETAVSAALAIVRFALGD